MDAAPTTSSNRKPQFGSLCSRPSAATLPPLKRPARPYPTPFSAHPSACPPGNARLNCCCQDLPQCGLHHCGDGIVDLRLRRLHPEGLPQFSRLVALSKKARSSYLDRRRTTLIDEDGFLSCWCDSGKLFVV
ncbi:hypothetical protein ACQJBY_072023 [Aegilops geniculata]